MERETNTQACCSETISTFKFTLDYNTWAANNTEEKRAVAQPIKLCSSQAGMCCVLLWGGLVVSYNPANEGGALPLP